MRWTERQRTMLREMGVQLWARGAGVEDDLAAGVRAAESPDIVDAGAAQGLPPAGVEADWRPSECLVVCDAAESAPGVGADRLLVRMLHAVQLSPDVPGPVGRACRLALTTGRSAGLDAAVAAVRPRAILALGRAAAQALLGSDEPLGRLRGRLHARAGVPVVVTFAPAYLLRHPEEKAKAWADLCLLAGALEPTSG